MSLQGEPWSQIVRISHARTKVVFKMIDQNPLPLLILVLLLLLLLFFQLFFSSEVGQLEEAEEL